MGAAPPGPAAIADELRHVLAAATGRPELARLALDTPLFGDGVGLDSLTGTLLLRQVRQRFGVDVAAEDLNLDSLATLGTLSAFLSERAGLAGEGAGLAGTAGLAGEGAGLAGERAGLAGEAGPAAGGCSPSRPSARSGERGVQGGRPPGQTGRA